MNNYICINGNKTALTAEQMKQLGITPSDPLIADLLATIRSGKAREHFKIHDTIILCGIEVEIIGFDHDKGANNNGAPMYTMTLMGKTLLHERRMHPGACERGWIDTDLRKWLNEEYFHTLPEELQKAIHPAIKLTHNFKGDKYETTDRLFLPSESEMFGSAIWSNYEDGARYEAFATRHNRIRMDEDGEECGYWMRSFDGGFSTNACRVGGNGFATNWGTSNAAPSPLCFLLA